MKITMQWLVEQLELPGFRFLAGQAGGAREIGGANMIDNPNTVPWLKQGDLVLTTGFFLQAHPESCEDLVRQLEQNGCAGLGIKLNRYVDRLPETMLRQAQELGFPIVAIPFSSNMEQIFRLIYRNIFQEEQNVNQQFFEQYRNLVDVTLKNQSLPRMVALMQSYLINPVYLLDEQMNLLEYACPDDDDNESGELFTPETVTYVQASHLEQNYPLIRCGVHWHAREVSATFMPLKYRQSLMGYLAIPEANRSLTSQDFELLTNVQPLLCIALLRYLQSGRSTVSPQDEHLLPLFTDSAMSDSSRRFQCVQQGVLFQCNHLLAQVRLDCKPHLTRGRLFLLHKKLFDQLNQENELCQITKISSESCLLLYFAFPAEQHKGTCEAYALHCCQALLKAAQAEQAVCDIGLSACISGIASLPVCYQQTGQVLELGAKLEPDAHIHAYSAHQVQYLIVSSLSIEQMQAFYDNVLGDLERYDRENHSDLLPLLQVYLDTDQNTKLTAQMLYIHRNTAIYKLKQICMVLGYDIKEPERLYTLQTAFYVKKLRAL